LDKVRAHGRQAAIGTLLIYADKRDREGTQRTLADLVAGPFFGRVIQRQVFHFPSCDVRLVDAACFTLAA